MTEPTPILDRARALLARLSSGRMPGAEVDEQRPAAPEYAFDLAISLGDECQAAHQLFLNGMRHAAYPFDWLETPFDSLYRLIECEFAGFLARENLEFRGRTIAETKFRVNIDHDFPIVPEFMPFYDQVRQRYDRRIARFLADLRSSQRIVFLRVNLTRAEAVRLTALLDLRYPNLDYLLVAIGHQEEMKTPWELPKVRNVHIALATPPVWHGDSEAYRELLESLAIRRTTTAAQAISNSVAKNAPSIRCANPPPAMSAGEELEVVVEVTAAESKNSSNGTAMADGMVMVGYHWFHSDRTVYEFEGTRTPLGRRLEPGTSQTVTAKVTAPLEPGQYILQWDLVIEYVTWFSARGWRGPEIPVRVEE